jgi:hypothetical protein
MPQHATVMMRVCRPEKTMSKSNDDAAKPRADQTRQLEPRDEDERPAPPRPPRTSDFIIDLDKTDPLRRFRF